MTAHVKHNSGNNEWYTPEYILERVRAYSGEIDLDPASSEIANTLVKAKRFYTKDNSGLDAHWSVGNVWLNPPYARGLMAAFLTKLITHTVRGDISQFTVLINNCTETKIVQELLGISKAICLLEKRVKFLDPQMKERGKPLQGQILIYYGQNEVGFERMLGDIGKVFVKA